MSDALSPTRLTKKLVTMVARPGKITTQGAVRMKFRPSAIITPHSGVGGCTPRPKKPSDAPARMSRTKSLMPKTSAGAITFGRRWRNMIADVAVPEAPGGQDVAASAGAQRLAPDDARVGDPADQRDRDVEVGQAGAEHRHDRQHEHEERERGHHVDDPAEDRVQPARVVPGEQAHHGAHDQRDDHADRADLQVGPRGEEHPASGCPGRAGPCRTSGARSAAGGRPRPARWDRRGRSRGQERQRGDRRDAGEPDAERPAAPAEPAPAAGSRVAASVETAFMPGRTRAGPGARR